MNSIFVQLKLLSNTTTYYGPLEYNLSIGVNGKSEDFVLHFDFFTDPIPNTVDQIFKAFPQVKNIIETSNIQDSISFDVKLYGWTAKDAHLLTFEKERFRCVFGDSKTFTSKELKKYFGIEDQTETKYKKILENVIKLFAANSFKEYLLIEKSNESNDNIVSNYSNAYKLIFSNATLNEFKININFIITDVLGDFNLTNDVNKFIKPNKGIIGSTYTRSLNCNTIDNLVLENTTPLFDSKKFIYIPISEPGSDNFKNYLNQMEILKNYSKFKQVDQMFNELSLSKTSVYSLYILNAIDSFNSQTARVDHESTNFTYKKEIMSKLETETIYNNLYSPSDEPGELDISSSLNSHIMDYSISTI